MLLKLRTLGTQKLQLNQGDRRSVQISLAPKANSSADAIHIARKRVTRLFQEFANRPAELVVVVRRGLFETNPVGAVFACRRVLLRMNLLSVQVNQGDRRSVQISLAPKAKSSAGVVQIATKHVEGVL